MFRVVQAGCIALILFLGATAANAQTGIRLDRLSPGHLKLWEALRRVIVAENADGIPLHPKLRSLFEQLQTSNQTIYLEFDDPNTGCQCVVGQFLIEQLDTVSGRNVGVIKLYPKVIQHASTDPLATQKYRFVPLAGLNKLNRYAEVLGHEMAHAVDILFNQERASMVYDVLKRTDGVLEQRLHNKTFAPELESLLRERDAFLRELEHPALIAEEQVWRELTNSHRK